MSYFISFNCIGGSVTAPSYSFIGDTDTGIFSSGANALNISTGGIERVRVDSAGFVGIGTITPISPLSVFTTVTQPIDVEVQSNSVANNIRQKRARDTAGVRSALLSGDLIGQNSFFGFGATAYSAATICAMQAVAEENFTDTAMGVALRFRTTPIGTVTGAERVRINNAGNVGIGDTAPATKLVVVGQESVSLGTVGVPSYSFIGDLDTGVYSAGADQVNIAAGGVNVVSVLTASITIGFPIQAAAGSASAPSFSFFSDTDTGLFSTVANTLSITTGGTLRVSVTTTGVVSNIPLYVDPGSSAAPSFSFSADTNTGLYSSAPDVLNFSLGGSSQIQLETTRVAIGPPLHPVAGSAAAPSYSFLLDPDTGLYTSAANTINVVTGGVSRVVISSTGIGFFSVAAAAQQVSGANLTNNVTAGGTTDTIADYSDLLVYANDAAAIRNDIYQLARKLKQVNDALRAYGLLT